MGRCLNRTRQSDSALNVRRADLAMAKVNAVCDGQEYPGDLLKHRA
jgi:hypothetical protein